MFKAIDDWRVPFWIGATLTSCVVNVVFLEKLISLEKGSTMLITFSCFLLLSIDGIIFTSKGFTKKPSVPLRYNAALVTLFFVINVANNQVYQYHVPMTLHMIFKSGSLMTSLVFGVWFLEKRYSMSKYIAVITITLGIFLCTYASAKQQPNGEDSSDGSYHYGEFIFGICLLSFTLIGSSYMGILQERLVSQFGRHPRESLFYNHMLPLPFFAFLYKDLAKQIVIYYNSEPYEIPVIGVTMPYMFVLLLCNTLTQYLCINSVFQLTSVCSSLTVTLVITVRKFLSLLISIFYFSNTFTPLHWIGAVMVFGGSGMFAELHTLFTPRVKPAKKVQ